MRLVEGNAPAGRDCRLFLQKGKKELRTEKKEIKHGKFKQTNLYKAPGSSYLYRSVGWRLLVTW